MTAPLSSLTATWANGATVFTAILMNVTNTASAAASLLMDLQVASSSKFSVSKDGLVAVPTGGQFAFSTDIFLTRDAAGILAQRNSTNAQAVRVYNTYTDASNYERGVFDWGTTANVLTIGTQAAGTGTGRNVAISAAGGTVTAVASTGFTVSDGAGNSATWSLLSGGRFTASGSIYSGTGGIIAGDLFNVDRDNGDVGLSRSAAHVLAIGADNSPGGKTGWFNYGGQKRVAADFAVTSSTALTNITGLSVAVQAGRTYSFEVWLDCSDAAAGGVQAAISGTATATDIRYTGYLIDTNTIKGQAEGSALGAAVASSTTVATSGLIIIINGTITVNAAGTLTVQFAQNTSSGTASTVKRGSSFIVQDMP